MMASNCLSTKARSLLLVGGLTIVSLHCNGDGGGVAPPDGPSIGLSETSKSFSAEQGGEEPPAQAVAVANAGAATLDGLTAEVSYTAGEPTGWLNAELSGTTAPAALTLTATTGGLGLGNYTATVSVASPVAGNSPQAVAVIFAVTQPPEGLLYSVSSIGGSLSTINPRTGVGRFVGRLGGSNNSLYTDLGAMAVTLDHVLVGQGSVMYVWSNAGDGTDPGAPNGRLLTVNTGTGEAIPVSAGTPPQGGMNAIAVSPAGEIYGTGFGGFYSVDPATGTRTEIALTGPHQISGLDFACDGTLYAMTRIALNEVVVQLVTINISTGEIGPGVALSQDVGTVGSIVFSRAGTLIGSASGPLGVILFDINTTTGQVSNLRPISGENVGVPLGMGFVRSVLSCRS